MNREQKAQVVDDLRSRFEAAPFVVLTDFKGSTVSDLEKFRRACDAQEGVTLQVVKNTLCRRAVEGTEKEILTKFFRGNIAVFISGEDPIAAAKLFKDQAKENKKLEVRAGFFEGDILDASGVEVVASLPSREELLVMLLRTIREAPRQAVAVIQAPARDLLYLLKNYEAKLENA